MTRMTTTALALAMALTLTSCTSDDHCLVEYVVELGPNGHPGAVARTECGTYQGTRLQCGSGGDLTCWVQGIMVAGAACVSDPVGQWPADAVPDGC